MSDSKSDTRDFLAEHVFPALDAVTSNLLYDLSPSEMKNSGSYEMTCPACSKPKRAYYFPGGLIICNRIGSCTEGRDGITIWKYLESLGYSKSEVFHKLCDAVGVQPPAKNEVVKPTVASLFRGITRGALKPSDQLVAHILSKKKLTPDLVTQMDLGYYPSEQYLRKSFENKGAEIAEAEHLGFLATYSKGKPTNNAGLMKGRLIGYWPQKNGSLAYWGYSPELTPKYLFSSGISKAIPYKYKFKSNVMITEGTFDADSCIIAGVPCCAIGQAGLGANQAEFLSGAGVTKVTHMIDADTAGIQGGIRTINTAYAYGLEVDIVYLGNHCDDADNLRKLGRIDLIRPAIKNAYPGHIFLALLLLKSACERPTFDLSDSILKAYKLWPSAKQELFDSQRKALNLTPNTTPDVLKKAAYLISEGNKLPNELILDLKERLDSST